MIVTVSLSVLAPSELRQFSVQTGLGSRRLEHPQQAALFRALADAADDEERRRMAQRPAFPHAVTLPLDEDGDPLNTDLLLDALLAVCLTFRDRSAAPGSHLGAVWGEITAQLGELRDERRHQSGEIGDLLTRPAVV